MMNQKREQKFRLLISCTIGKARKLTIDEIVRATDEELYYQLYNLKKKLRKEFIDDIKNWVDYETPYISVNFLEEFIDKL